jgi:hypothetical protein
MSFFDTYSVGDGSSGGSSTFDPTYGGTGIFDPSLGGLGSQGFDPSSLMGGGMGGFDPSTMFDIMGPQSNLAPFADPGQTGMNAGQQAGNAATQPAQAEPQSAVGASNQQYQAGTDALRQAIQQASGQGAAGPTGFSGADQNNPFSLSSIARQGYPQGQPPQGGDALSQLYEFNATPGQNVFPDPTGSLPPSPVEDVNTGTATGPMAYNLTPGSVPPSVGQFTADPTGAGNAIGDVNTGAATGPQAYNLSPQSTPPATGQFTRPGIGDVNTGAATGPQAYNLSPANAPPPAGQFTPGPTGDQVPAQTASAADPSAPSADTTQQPDPSADPQATKTSATNQRPLPPALQNIMNMLNRAGIPQGLAQLIRNYLQRPSVQYQLQRSEPTPAQYAQLYAQYMALHNGQPPPGALTPQQYLAQYGQGGQGGTAQPGYPDAMPGVHAGLPPQVQGLPGQTPTPNQPGQTPTQASTGLPQGIPAGSQYMTTTPDGNRIYRAPDGRFMTPDAGPGMSGGRIQPASTGNQATAGAAAGADGGQGAGGNLMQTNLTAQSNANAPQLNRNLAGDRQRYAQELQRNPQLLRRLFQVAYNEQGVNPAGTQAIIESAMNRASVRGTSLATQLRWHRSEGGYYAEGGGFRSPNIVNDPRVANVLNRSLSNALSGSNVSNFATDNSSGRLAAGEWHSGKFTPQSAHNRESFFSPGWGERALVPKWQRWRQSMGGAGPRGQTQTAGGGGTTGSNPLLTVRPQAQAGNGGWTI